ncbi:hypothetical protein ACLBSW_24590, partial [Pseudomonas aeruginosa]
MRGNDERRSPAEGASTEAEVSAFEAVLIDPMQEKDEELKDRQFVTALARGLELLRCFTLQAERDQRHQQRRDQ